MSLLDDLLTDLKAEGDQLWSTVSGLDEGAWETPTPASGWDIAHQIAHLLWTDDVVPHLLVGDPDGYIDSQADEVSRLAPEALLARWGSAREELAMALREYPEGQKIAWFGPPMSPASMATARFMETWAHGLDVYQALGVEPEPTDRIRHVCHLGVRTRNFAYAVHELDRPDDDVRVELTSPSGDTWAWGPEDAAQRVTGSAYDFARLVTQRIHREDTDLVATGDEAEEWLGIAQAFAGPPGEGREKR